MFRKINEKNYIDRLRAKDERALEYVVAQYGGLLYSILHKYLHLIPDDIDECFDDVMMKVWENASRFDEERSSFKNWLAAIARYQSIDYLRRAKREGVGENKISLDDSECETGTEDLMLKLIEDEIDDGTEEILGCLSPLDREIFRRHYIKGDSIEEVSDDMNMTKGQVYTRMSRGKKRLRDYYINCKESSYERCI